MDDQIQKLDRGVDVLIATPGRLLDHFQRGKVMLMGVEILVIDEADRMLDMGFIPDIERICKLLPPRKQTLFFSATMPPEITRLVAQFLTDPARIEVAKPATTATTITQLFRFCDSTEDWAKREMLRDLIRSLEVRNAIIFSNRKRDVAILLKSLLKHGFNAGALHGDMDQASRTATLDKFRSGEIALLAASDVAARGLDIPDVSHVINYDVPWQADDYVHRIGRTGRAGKEGCSVTIVTPEDVKSVDSIVKLTEGVPVWIGEVPDEEKLAEGRTRRRGRGGRGDRGPPPKRGAPGRGERDHGRRGNRAPEAGRGERESERAPRRDRERSRPEPVEAEVSLAGAAAPEPVQQQPRRVRRPPPQAQPQPDADFGPLAEPRAKRGDRGERSDRPQRPERNERPRRPEGEERRPRQDNRRDQDRSAPVVGLGDHVPAFLRRPVRAIADR